MTFVPPVSHPTLDLAGTVSNSLAGKKIVLAVTGSIAAVETIRLARELIRHGAIVQAVMSEAAQTIIHPYALQYATGRDVIKFAEARLTPIPGLKVRAPLIRECPVNLECVVRNFLVLGSHVLFLAEVVALHADDEVVENGGVIMGRVAPLAYDPFGGDYWSLKEVVAHQGFSGGTMPNRADPNPATG